MSKLRLQSEEVYICIGVCVDQDMSVSKMTNLEMGVRFWQAHNIQWDLRPPHSRIQ
jgi:hypothetical protein